MGRGCGAPGFDMLHLVFHAVQFRAPWRCSVFIPPFPEICVQPAVGVRASGGEKRAGRQWALSTHSHVPTSWLPRASCLHPGTGGGGGRGGQCPGSPGPGPWAPVGITATLDAPIRFHVSMNSQVSCSEERDNQPTGVWSPRVVGVGVYPNFPISQGPS